MPSYNVHDAKSNFSKLLKMAERGEQVTLMRGGRPAAKLVPLTEELPRERKLGWAEGVVVETEGWEKAMTDEEVDALLGRGL